jgi:hypothetical protein
MQVEVNRKEASEEHKVTCNKKLDILNQQFVDLTGAIDNLLLEYSSGTKFMKVYRQVKMYNDPSLNPVLYQVKSSK